MSEHALPPDPASWPRDPFRLLGVRPGVSARDLRKAYLRLIRSYKPEHAPEEFRRIRDAYESALPFARALERQAAEDDAEPRPRPDPEAGPIPITTPAPAPSPDSTTPDLGPDRPASAPGPWELACRGEPEAAYRALVARSGRGRADEDDYLRLYWLLALVPALEPARCAVDWVAKGLGARGADAPRLRELLRRELAADPALAAGDRLASLLRRPTPPAVAVDFAEARWRAARGAGRWASIANDLETLRAWLPGADEAAWSRLLVAAAIAFAWAEGQDVALARDLARELDATSHRLRDHADDLYQVEYAQIVRAGLERLGGRRGPYAAIHRMLELSWDEPGPESRARLRAYVDQLARDPAEALRCLDEIHATAPAVLGRLSGLLGGLDDEAHHFLAPAHLDEFAPAIAHFLDRQPWDDYPALRPQLLRFCLREALSPALAARTIADRPEFLLTGKNPLALAILEDWPLRHAYRAAEMAREAPDET